MPARTEHLSFPANWSVQFLCNCANQESELHRGVTHTISLHGMRLLSNHPICQHKKIAIHLMVPHPGKAAQYKIVKIIGNTLTTCMRAGHFLCEVDFEHFEEDGRHILEQKLFELAALNLPLARTVLHDTTFRRGIAAQRS